MRAELLDLAVAQEDVDDRVVLRHLLQRVGVGRGAGLGLLDRREPELLEEHDAQLRRRVDVELLAGDPVDLADEEVALLGELAPEIVEEDPVDRMPGVLHLRQHPYERALEPLVEVGQLAGVERLGERVGELEDGGGAPAGVVGRGVAVEVEGPGLGVGRLDLHGEVPQRQVLEAVLPLGGVEEVRHDRGVVAQRADVGAEPVHQLLGAVRRRAVDRRARAARSRPRRRQDRRGPRRRSR